MRFQRSALFSCMIATAIVGCRSRSDRDEGPVKTAGAGAPTVIPASPGDPIPMQGGDAGTGTTRGLGDGGISGGMGDGGIMVRDAGSSRGSAAGSAGSGGTRGSGGAGGSGTTTPTPAPMPPPTPGGGMPTPGGGTPSPGGGAPSPGGGGPR